MTALVLVALGVALWCLVPLPAAIVVGRAFRAGEVEDEFAGIVRNYDAVGM